MGKPRADEVDDLESSGISLDGGIKVHTTTFIRGATACIGASIATIAHASQLVLAQGGQPGQSSTKDATVLIGTGIIGLIVVFWFVGKRAGGKSKAAKGRSPSGPTRFR